jgi:deoxyribodipyrimidine photo-lyase
MTSLFENEIELFPASYDEILQRVRRIDPVKYGATRNYLDGAVTYLSPYISRGVISTRWVLAETLKRGYDPNRIEKFIQELAWRDYWQQVWIDRGDDIDSDLKQPQCQVSNHAMPRALIEAQTGIVAVDKAIGDFLKTGYLHNHMRMYLAAIACNLGRSHWKIPARWMYYHLLDGDWASNALSWQWVAGANSRKKYYANQENVNRYCRSDQRGTFLDVPYQAFETMEIPEALAETGVPELVTTLPSNTRLEIDKDLPTCIYNYYNLDPMWKKDARVNRVLLLEPSHFGRYPISQKSLDFMLALTGNITGIQVYVGEFSELVSAYDLRTAIYKEHPLNAHYKGIEEPRDWMFDVKGCYPSFFAFWKKCRKELFRQVKR